MRKNDKNAKTFTNNIFVSTLNFNISKYALIFSEIEIYNIYMGYSELLDRSFNNLLYLEKNVCFGFNDFINKMVV